MGRTGIPPSAPRFSSGVFFLYVTHIHGQLGDGFIQTRIDIPFLKVSDFTSRTTVAEKFKNTFTELLGKKIALAKGAVNPVKIDSVIGLMHDDFAFHEGNPSFPFALCQSLGRFCIALL